MPPLRENVQLIIAEDDEDDYTLAKTAFAEAGLSNELVWVRNGEELLDLLQDRGAYTNAFKQHRARLIILDLNMPRMDGREAIERIKADPYLRTIPIIVMTTSGSEEDITRSYDQGVCSFIRKPSTFEEFVQAARVFNRYWLKLVELPGAVKIS